jgi:DNA-directed RNA polymerase alpha subunit
MTPEQAETYSRRVEVLLLSDRFETAHAVIDLAELETLKSVSYELDTRLGQTSISPRNLNLLERRGIFTVGDLLKTSPSDLAGTPNIGGKTIDSLRETLAECVPSESTDGSYDEVLERLAEEWGV